MPSTTTDPDPVPLTVTTAAAAEVLRTLGDGGSDDAPALRIAVSGVHGAEYTYDLGFVDGGTAGPGDRLYEQGALTVLVPADSAGALWGATLDRSSPFGPGLVIRNPNRPAHMSAADLELDGSVTDRIELLLLEVINPGLAAHGGRATLVEVDEDARRAVIEMGGGCQGCAVSELTLEAGIRRTILERIPEIDEVIDATDHARGENPYHA